MEGHQEILLVLIFASFSFSHCVQAQPDQQEFISLDCGLPTEESPYIEPITKLNFTSDSEFIHTGKSGQILDQEIASNYKQYNNLRYFPDGKRNCYTLIVNQGEDYLIRAGFFYANYDGRNTTPEFDLYIGPNLWTTVDSLDEDDYEIIHKPKSKTLQICVVKTGETTPMISTLELRPLREGSYNTQSGSLRLSNRYMTLQSESGSGLRYPDDVFDRIWISRSNFIFMANMHFPIQDRKQINTTLTVRNSSPFELPQAVLRTADTPTDANSPLSFSVFVDSNYNVSAYLHFAEIQALQPNVTREFDILLDDNIIAAAYSPKMLQLDTIYNKEYPMHDEVELKLVKTTRSTLPPILNAYEFYVVMEFPYSDTNPSDVAALKNIQITYGLKIITWQGDPCLPEDYRWKGIECDYYTNRSTPPRIISLDLSGHQLRGNISPSLQNLTELKELDLSNNSLSGGVPEFLASMKSLLIINLSQNNLKGKIPRVLREREKNGLTLITQKNDNLCENDKCKNSNTRVLVLSVALIASLIIIVALIALFFFAGKKRKLKVRRRSPNINKSIILNNKRVFTYSEVEAMTNNFERVLGEGGFGEVYHGSLNDTEHVAVKLLSQSSTQGYKQFKAEVDLLLRVHHTNLVSLVGYCNEKDHLALVYEYASNGDLKRHLSGESDGVVLNWATRLRIATETAQGLEYLHTGCKPPMIHRDVKTTNILLDDTYQAKLADFGLTRSFQIGAETHVSTNVAGTPGYLDPEYYRTNRLSEKSDVYSLGIVLLEMISSQPVVQQSREKAHIGEWVGLKLTKGDIESIMDPKLNGDYDLGSIWKALELAMSCVNPSSSGRPNMSQVVVELKDCLDTEKSRKGEKYDMGSKSSLELSSSFTTEVTPYAR